MPEEVQQLLISDSSVLINFLCIGRLQLLTTLPYRVLLTDVVRDEIQRRHESEQVEKAIAAGQLEIITFSDPAELQVIARLRTAGLGTGEAVSIVAAAKLQALLAIDDIKATKTALRTYPHIQCLTTQDIIVLNIQRGALTVEQADSVKDEWATQHRFLLKIASFRLLIE